MIEFKMETEGFKRDVRALRRRLEGESGREVQKQVDAVYDSRTGRSLTEIQADLESRLRRLDVRFGPGETEDWAQVIHRGERIQIRVEGTPRLHRRG